MNRIKKFLKNLKATTRRPEMSILPGQLAFYFLLMMIPIFTVVVVILQQLELSGAVRTILYDTLPNVVADLIVNISNEDVGVVSFWALLISAFIISSNGTYSIIIASNTIYKVENQGAVLNRIKSLVMVVIMILTFVVIFTVPLFGNTIATFAEKVLRLSNYHIDVQSLYGIFKYPVTLLFLFLFVKLLYTIAPNVKLGLNKTSYGALFTSIMWIIVTMVYSVYIEKVVNYETIYGGLSSLLCLLIWLSIISYIFVLGMALNASYYSINKDDINYIEKGLGKTKNTLSKLRNK
jgi:membrane protein